jgi:hypothetical protein
MDMGIFITTKMSTFISALTIVNGKPKFLNSGVENSPDLLKTFALCFVDGIYPSRLG